MLSAFVIIKPCVKHEAHISNAHLLHVAPGEGIFFEKERVKKGIAFRFTRNKDVCLHTDVYA